MTLLSRFRLVAYCSLALTILAAGDVAQAQDDGADSGPVQYTLNDDEMVAEAEPGDASAMGDSEFEPSVWTRWASFLQPQPARVPQRQVTADTGTTAAGQLTQRNISLPTSLLTQGVAETNQGPATESVASGEAQSRASTDVGSLIGRSPSLLGVGTQKRTPIVNDPRIRGSRIGQLAASGSYWVPARIDLDTAVSKLDSHVVDNVTIIKGPYSAQYGPNWNFMVIDLLDTPRFANGRETHSSTEANYKTNGQQLMGRETLWGGDENSGYRANYVHRTGNDYLSGNGTKFNSSYNSREFDLALGKTFEYGGYVEFNYLRLDQTGVEFPGMAFDIDDLVTDGFEFETGLTDEIYFDKLALEMWYNRTRFNGFQGPNKQTQFPIFNDTSYQGRTDVDGSSFGYKAFVQWGDPADDALTIGTDLRLIRQELNEIASGVRRPAVFENANSPIPKSYSVDPGVYVERFVVPREDFRLRAGARASWTNTNVDEDPANLARLGNYGTGDPDPALASPNVQPTFQEIVATDQLNQNFVNLAAFLSGEFDLDEDWMLRSGAGVARRPPSLTELYAAQPFMFLIQNGLNTVTGDPLLKAETIAQVDLGLNYQGERTWAGISGFHAWGSDYITFESTSKAFDDANNLAQTNLKYVNTDLATFAGFEAFFQHETTDWLSSFATVSYVDGRDRTRNGKFQTQEVGMANFDIFNERTGSPSERVAGTRGGIDKPEESLPGILPMDARLGIRLHPEDQQRWGYEVSARVVRMQNRVATSLNESSTSGFTVWDMRGYWQAREQIRLIGGIENFGNKNFREHLDFRSPSGYVLFQPGINFYFGSEVTF